MFVGARTAVLFGDYSEPSEYWGLTFTANEPNVTVGMSKLGSPDSITLEASTDGGATWTTFVSSSDNVTPVTLANAGDKVYIRAGSGGNTKISKTVGAIRYFSLSRSVAASGNIMSLLTQNEGSWQSVAMGEFCFGYLFYDCTTLTTAPALAATTLASYCYYNMFQNCSSLTAAPALPATTLVSQCYGYMFRNCISLISAPALPATTLADACYDNMFSGCTSLISAPALPATTLAQNCYWGMFSGCSSLASAPRLDATTLVIGCYGNIFRDCTSLISAPALPATTLAQNCYWSMFEGCTSLTSAPALSATTLADNCYASMFLGCTSLAAAPALPATTLANGCYQAMFEGCTSLTSAPALSAATLTVPCYASMFEGCTSLRSVDVGFTSWVSGATDNWLRNVASTGTFTCPSALDTTTRDASHVPSGWTVGRYWGLTFTAESANTTIGMEKSRTPPSVTLEKSTDDGNTWTSFNPDGGSVTLANVGDKVYFRAGVSGNTGFASDYYTYYRFTIPNGSAAASGNIMSLLTQNESGWQSVTMASNCFRSLFQGCTGLTSAPALPATTLTATYCYSHMFKGCTSLTSAPVLPATTLTGGCYFSMFQGCTGLTSAPALPATTLTATYCYSYMFKGCTSLTSAPALPATTLADYCYENMFEGCTGLTSAPALPVTTLAQSCYYGMFRGCTSLTSAPVLPATTLANNCYSHMFIGCTSLTSAPALPATTLSRYCYYHMFANCTSLTSAPELPATTLADSCYGNMFCGCTSLNSVTVGFTSWLNGATTDWLSNVAASGTFTCPPALDTTTRDASHVPSGWTVNAGEYWGLTFTANEANCTIGISKTGSPDPITLEASTDGGATWTTFVDSSDNVTSITLASVGDKAYIRAGSSGNASFSKSDSACRRFILSGSIAASGNIMSLLTQNESDWRSVTMGAYCFYALFYAQTTSLTAAPSLPATSLADYCYSAMFAGCTALEEAPELPATELASCCYLEMFMSCFSITEAPELPATTLASHCYDGMFYNCRTLTSAPELPATTLAEGCYAGMFKECIALTTAPELPATTLATNCYWGMFYGCTALRTAPELSETTLAQGCYGNMFRDCTALATAPALPATTLADYCYQAMFYGCIALTTAPILPATTLTRYCYAYMFQNCSSLASVEVGFTVWNMVYNATKDWLSGVASSGTFKCPNTLDTTSRSVSTIPSGWVVNPYYGLTFTAESANTTIGMAKTGTPPSVTLEKSTDGGISWTSFDPNGGSVTLANIGDKVSFRAGSSGNTGFASSTNSYYSFTIPNGSAAASGNIMSLLTQNEGSWQSVSMGEYCFCRLFYECASLTSAPTLPATTLADNCYYQMFLGCTSLTSAPTLPATTLAYQCYLAMFSGCTSLASAPELPAMTLEERCYYNMFYGCTSLASAPALPATTLAISCYDSMFKGCTSLASAPALPATTLAISCYYQMFDDCRSLASAPALPATTLADFCYGGMFYGCTSLTSAPALPATTLAIGCYAGMFERCTSLASAPALPATTLASGCYYGMFDDCRSLNSVTVGFTSWLSGATDRWLYGVAASGTFICPNALDTTTRDASHVPSGWTVDTGEYWGLTFTAGAANTTIGMAKTGTPPSVTLEKSTDNGDTWTSFDPDGGSVTLANVGDKVCFRAGSSGNAGFASGTNSYYGFTIPNGSAAASGNIMSLLTQNESGWQSVSMGIYCFGSLFIGCAGLTSAPALPATTLATLCYSSMFWGCTSLASAPVLPAATLADNCYFCMFYDCTSLNSVTVEFTSWLSATTDWLNGVAASGTFICPSDLDTTTRNASRVPSGWTVANPSS